MCVCLSGMVSTALAAADHLQSCLEVVLPHCSNVWRLGDGSQARILDYCSQVSSRIPTAQETASTRLLSHTCTTW